MGLVRVKICCISSVDEAKTAINHGASALGLVGRMPSGPGVIDDKLIHAIARIVPPPVSTFLLTSETRTEAVIAHHQKVHTTTIQLVDKLEDNDYKMLRIALPTVKLVQVIHVRNEGSIEEALEAAEQVDALLLDSGNPSLPIKVLGGTGTTHDWALSRRIREQVNIPLFLAGGLRADNVQQAIEAVQPFGVDLCSGVRTAGRLDEQKLEAFFTALGNLG
jgi:phosphoribosylanthranilate isomerase